MPLIALVGLFLLLVNSGLNAVLNTSIIYQKDTMWMNEISDYAGLFGFAFMLYGTWKNDRLGHEEGNRLLLSIANRIRRTVRNIDLVVRYGGDEFVVVLLNTNHEEATKVWHRMEDAIYQLGASYHYGIGLSGGIATYPDDGKTAETVLALADQRMYDEKVLMKEINRNI